MPNSNNNSSSNKKVINRLVKSAANIMLDKAGIEDAIFQHSVLCQTFLPYRNPGDDVKIWQQKCGRHTRTLSWYH